MQWTNDQHNAINLPVSDMLVSAAAGSGKTAVMAERILSRITGEKDFVDIDRILVVTYTSAAASEIKERIMKRIMSKLDEGDNPRLSSQLVKLPYSHISTIHSFCLDLIRKYFYILGIDPQVKIADETDVKSMKKQSAEAVLDNHYNSDDIVFKEMISDYTHKNDSSICDLIISIYNYSRTMPDSEKWLYDLRKSYEGNSQKALNTLAHFAHLSSDYLLKQYDNIIALCNQNPEGDKLANFFMAERQEVYSASLNDDYFGLKKAFEEIKYANWRSAQGPDELRAIAHKKRDELKKFVSDVILKKYLPLTEDDITEENNHVILYIDKFVELAIELGSNFDAMKMEKNLIDFSDFEHMALKLLSNPDGTPSEIAYSVSNDFDEIYIDEYQDCNNIQNKIFEYISGSLRGKPNVFCVGDMKQSIYGFRDSNPLLFRDKCEAFPLFDGIKAGNANKIFLSKNFRSTSTILNFVNFVFSQIMSTDCGDLTYDDNEKLNYGASYKDVNEDISKIDLAIIDASNTFGDEYSPNEDALSSIEAEAVYVGNKIKHYISSGYKLYDQKTQTTRPASYSDMVVLVRSASGTAPVFEKVFTKMGIPVYNDKGASYFDTAEIKFLISLLKIIDNPDDDIALVSVLKNPIFGFDENMLLKMRLLKTKASYYDCIKSYCNEKTDLLSQKTKAFLTLIDDYYDKSRYMDTDEFLSHIIKDLNFNTYLSLSPDSDLKKTNVKFLLKKAREFERNGYKGIYSFVRYIENYGAQNSADSAKILSENDNVVRIMTIHKSKGLEFPIVFLSSLGKQFNMSDSRERIVLHRDLGIGVESIYRSIGARFNTINMTAIKRKLIVEGISEQLRVLYVALTRAQQKLVMTSCVSNGAKLLSQVEQAVLTENDTISPYLIYTANSFIKILLYAMVRGAKFPKSPNTNFAKVIDAGCNFNLDFLNISDISLSEDENEVQNWQSFFDGTTDKFPFVQSELSYAYKYNKSSLLPTNMTVTEIKKLSDNDDYYSFDDINLSKPSEFGKKGSIAGSDYGTLVHYVMEKIDIISVNSEKDLETQLAYMEQNSLLAKDEISTISIPKLYKFFTTDIAIRMRERHQSLFREYSFKYFADASVVLNSDTDDKIVVQGTVDAFFEDDDGQLVIVDYKTDKLIGNSSEYIKDKYRTQLEYYACALEKVFGKKVKEKIIYLFDTNETLIL